MNIHEIELTRLIGRRPLAGRDAGAIIEAGLLGGYTARARSRHRGQWLTSSPQDTPAAALVELWELCLAEYTPGRREVDRDCPLFQAGYQARLV